MTFKKNVKYRYGVFSVYHNNALLDARNQIRYLVYVKYALSLSIII